MAGKRSKNSNHAQKIYKKKEPFSFSKLPAEKKKIIEYAALGIIALAIILIVLGQFDLLPHLNGSMRVINGKLSGAKENDLIVNMGNTTKTSYYNVGSVDFPQGYTDDEEFTIKPSGSLETDFVFRPDDPESHFNFVAICACSKPAESLLETVRANTGETVEGSEEKVHAELTEGKSKVKGNAFRGYIYANDVKDEYSGMFSKYFTAYIDTNKDDTCILVQVHAKEYKRADLPTDEEFMALMEEATDWVNVK